MRVGFRDLTLWSFLMASAHGAGLMVLPVLFGLSEGGHAGHMTGAQSLRSAALAVGTAHAVRLLGPPFRFARTACREATG